MRYGGEYEDAQRWQVMMSVFRLFWAFIWIAAVSGCTTRASVGVTADTAGNVSYAYVTVSGVWLHENATATAVDAGWHGKTLSQPVTIDLAQLNDGTVETLLSGTNIDGGTYHALRLVLVDNNSTLTTSASDAGLSHNNDVYFLNSASSWDTEPLELATPNGNLIFAINLTIVNGSSGTQILSNISSGSSSTTASVTIDANLIRGLDYFDYSGQSGVLLNPAVSATNDDAAGAVTGALDLSDIASSQRKSAQGIIITAERPSDDGTRYVEIKSTALSSSGSFTLSPLPADSDTSTYYQIVIHGDGIQTVVIANVPVNASETTTLQSDDLVIANADHYQVNTADAQSGIPANTHINFYQTLSHSALPYLVEQATLNPFTGTLYDDIALSLSKVAYGEYNDGDDIVFTTLTPSEGAGVYQIVSSAPLYDTSALNGMTVSGSTANASVTIDSLPTMTPANNAGGVSVSGTVTLSTPGTYDSGFLLLTHGGQLVDVVNLGDALAATGSTGTAAFDFSSVPSGIGAARYELSARLWNSTDPSGTLRRIDSGASVDLRGGNAATVNFTVP
jgi:hypothetical protein